MDHGDWGRGEGRGGEGKGRGRAKRREGGEVGIGEATSSLRQFDCRRSRLFDTCDAHAKLLVAIQNLAFEGRECPDVLGREGSREDQCAPRRRHSAV